MGIRQTVEQWVPALRLLHNYRANWFRADLLAGVTVASMQIPVAIAHAELAGLPAVMGIYTSLWPLLIYALLGSSRQLYVGTDSATCAILAATLIPLAAGDPARYVQLSAALTVLVGICSILGGLVRLGVLANFLSRPILVGFLNGVALNIIGSQIGKLCGIPLKSTEFFPRLFEYVEKIEHFHLPTLILGLGLIALVFLFQWKYPRVPGPLIIVGTGTTLMMTFQLQQFGIETVDPIAPGLPPPLIPRITAGDLHMLALDAVGISLVSFCSAMLTARSFASKKHDDLDPSQDFFALGVANIASGCTHGFVVSGGASQTNVVDAVGGKSQVTSLVAAVVMMVALCWFTGPLAWIPSAALAAMLISGSLSLFNVQEFARLGRVSRFELTLSIGTTIGVLSLGMLPGILIAVGLAIINLLRLDSDPHDAILGEVPGLDGFNDINESPDSRTVPGLLIYRYDASLVFFNADHFRSRVRKLLLAQDPRPKWLLFDAESASKLDATGAEVLEDLRAELEHRGIVLAIGRAKGFFRHSLDRSGLTARIGEHRLFPSIRSGVQAFLESQENQTK